MWIQPEDPETIEETQKLLRTPAVQAAAWGPRPAARVIEAGRIADMEINDWINRIDRRLEAGGLVMHEAGDDPRFVLHPDVTAKSLISLISGPR